MRAPKLRTLLWAAVTLLVIGYAAIAIRVATYDNTAPEPVEPPSPATAKMDAREDVGLTAEVVGELIQTC